MKVSLLITEEQFVAMIIEAAQYLGWRVYHQRPAMLKNGTYRTAVQGDKGFPDLVLAKEGRETLFWEVKAENGKVTPEQQAWLDVLGGRVVRPQDWEAIKEELTAA